MPPVWKDLMEVGDEQFDFKALWHFLDSVISMQFWMFKLQEKWTSILDVARSFLSSIYFPTKAN